MNELLAAALAAQLERRRATVAAGAEHVGWKLGMGDRESIGGEIAVGHLTSATCLPTGSTYTGADTGELHADAEVAVELDEHGIARYGVALELVDLTVLPGEPRSVVAANVFHRAVAFGPLTTATAAGAQGRLLVNGEVRASAAAANDLAGRVEAAAKLLAAVGERLGAGDRIITGSIVQVSIRRGDDVVAELDGHGEARLTIGD